MASASYGRAAAQRCGSDGLARRGAGDAHESRGGLDHQIHRRLEAPRTGLSEAGDRHIDQPRIGSRQRRNFKEVVDDEQTAARNMTPVVQHAEAGPIRVLGVPVQLSETPGRIASASPALGADTAAVLGDLLP